MYYDIENDIQEFRMSQIKFLSRQYATGDIYNEYSEAIRVIALLVCMKLVVHSTSTHFYTILSRILIVRHGYNTVWNLNKNTNKSFWKTTLDSKLYYNQQLFNCNDLSSIQIASYSLHLSPCTRIVFVL